MSKKRNQKKLRAQASPEAAQRLAEFDRNLAALTPVTPGVFVLLAAFVLLFAAAAYSAKELARPLPADVLKHWGASAGSVTLPHGGWRLLTATFIHYWVVQLLFNAWTLLDLGRFMERVLGRVGFFLVFLITGFAGNVASLAVQPDRLVAGSTGAVFGLLGALAGFVLRYRSSFPPGALARLRMSVPAFIAFNVGYGLIKEDLNSAEYLGGLLSGLVCGVLLARPLSAENAARRWRVNLLLGLLAILFVLGAGWALAPRANLGLERARLSALDDQLVERYQKDLALYEAKKLSPRDFADVIDKDLLPEWRKACSRLTTLEGVPPRDRAYWDDLKEYAKLRQQAWELTADALRLGDDDVVESAKRKEAEAADLAKKIAERYGSEKPKNN